VLVNVDVQVAPPLLSGPVIRRWSSGPAVKRWSLGRSSGAGLLVQPSGADLWAGRQAGWMLANCQAPAAPAT